MSEPQPGSGPDTLFHAALPEDWAQARLAGRYEVSTRGRSLAQEGFIHASYSHQVERVVNSFYADVAELVLLVIARGALGADVVDESPTGDPGDEHYPHIYGSVPLTAIVSVRDWRRGTDGTWRLADALGAD